MRHPALQLPTQEKYGHIGTSPWEGHNDQRTGASYCGDSRDCLVWMKAGSCETLWHPLAPKEVYKRVVEGLYTSACSGWTRGFKLKVSLGFRLDIGKILLMVSMGLELGSLLYYNTNRSMIVLFYDKNG